MSPPASAPAGNDSSNPSADANVTMSAHSPTVAVTELHIGDHCQVQWRDKSQTLEAVVIEKRPKKKRKYTISEGQKKKKKAEEEEDGKAAEEDGKQEYYVHYIEHDRRLDEWIDFDKFVLETLVKKPEEPNPDESEEADGSVRRGPRRRAAALPAASSSSTTEFRTLTGGNWHGGSGDPSLAELEKEHEETTKVKNISKIIMGGWEVEAWYYSPYPDAYTESEVLFVCEYCLKYMKHPRTFKNHRSSCKHRRPPGTEIYRHQEVSVYEVDGKEARVYCQNLCLLAKLFLDHKTLYYDVDPFFFYIVCQVDEYGAHMVGYFSKEKVSAEDYNLACILTFPQYQKLGYGKFLISLSYELTKRQGKTGSPEKPLSDLGKISYRSYWTYILMHLLAGSADEHLSTKKNKKPPQDLSIKDMSFMTGIKTEDIISTLQSLDMIKCWKGQHVVYVKQDILENYMKQEKHFRLCHSDYLKWTPPSERKKGQ